MNGLLKNNRVEIIPDNKIKLKRQMNDSMHSLVTKQTINKKTNMLTAVIPILEKKLENVCRIC